MGILPDTTIKNLNESLISPFNRKQVQPASYDLTLDRYFRRFVPAGPGNRRAVDPRDPTDYSVLDEVDDRYLLEPHAFVLASTVERVTIPDDLVGRVEGRSSLGRLGLFVHVTAGFIDPGFQGHITLELFCAHPNGLWLYPGMPIGQIAFEKMSGPCSEPYGASGRSSKYQGQGRGPAASQFWRNFSGD